MTTIESITGWLDETLAVASFHDASNNGLQIAREGNEVTRVALGVDASTDFFRRAAEANCQFCVVHHGLSWNGGIRRLTGSAYRAVKAAMTHNLALYAVHLPLDANKTYGHNWEIARHLGLSAIRPAFDYHGQVIGVMGQLKASDPIAAVKELFPEVTSVGVFPIQSRRGNDVWTVGVCSGGGAGCAEEAAELGCDFLLTGEANWAEVIAAENVGMPLCLAGHYQTEVFGLKALAAAMPSHLPVETVFL